MMEQELRAVDATGNGEEAEAQIDHQGDPIHQGY
jgi:hypothetical protein